MITLLRPILEAALKRPGAIFQPLYISPVERVAELAGEVSQIGQSRGLPVFLDFREWQEKGGGAGVVLVEERDLERASQQESAPGVQFIGWGRPVTGLDEAARRWLGQGWVVPGLADMQDVELDDHGLGAITEQAKSLLGNLTVLVADQANILGISQELRIRLEAEEHHVVMAPEATEIAKIWQAAQTSEAVHIIIGRINGTAELAQNVEVLEGLQSFRQTGGEDAGNLTPIIIITSKASWKELAKYPIIEAYKSKMSVFRLDTSTLVKEEEALGLWPSLSDILDSLPIYPARPEVATTGWTEWDMDGAIELFSYMQSSGMADLTVYNEFGCGRIRLRNNQIVDVELTGDGWTTEKLMAVRRQVGRNDCSFDDCRYDLINDRIRHIIQWPRSKVVQVKAAPGEVGVPKNGVAIHGFLLDISSWIDEKRQMTPHALNTIWAKKGQPDWPTDAGINKMVWGLVDGKKTAWGIAGALGIGQEAIMQIMNILAETGLLVEKGKGLVPDRPTADDVAMALLATGLAEEALVILDKAFGAAAMEPGALAMYAGLKAVLSGPTKAVALMEEAVGRSGGEEWLARRMDLAIIRVRSGKKPGKTWKELQRDMGARPAQAGKTWSVRQYAKWGELAIRNKDLQAGEEVVAALKRVGNAAADTLGDKLAERLSTNA